MNQTRHRLNSGGPRIHFKSHSKLASAVPLLAGVEVKILAAHTWWAVGGPHNYYYEQFYSETGQTMSRLRRGRVACSSRSHRLVLTVNVDVNILDQHILG